MTHVEALRTSAQTGLQRLADEFLLFHDEESARKIQDLVHQGEDEHEQVLVAFCGLFSAGKSTLINTLCQSNALATGAVPTTAKTTQAELPDTDARVILLDTPGIDSTDESHQEETRAALHRAHVVCLVMDYQHVEAGENLEFAYELCAQGKTLVLVINQIDKHVEWEIPFADFRSRVEQVFEDWDIAYRALYYVSCEDTESGNPSNQISHFRDYLTNLAHESISVSKEGVYRSVLEIIRAHVESRLSTRRTEVEQAVLDRFTSLPFDVSEARDWREESERVLDEAQEEIRLAKDTLKSSWTAKRQEILRSIELSQVAPYDTTERGRLFVESLRDTFRVGWFRTEQKTAEARAQRLDAFRDDLLSHVEKFLVWPLQASLREYVNQTLQDPGAPLAQIEQVTWTISGDELNSMVKRGALASSLYPYQYVKDVVQAVKRQVTAKTVVLLEDCLRAANAELDGQLQGIEDARNEQSENIKVLDSWVSLNRDSEEEIARLSEYLNQ